MKKAVELAACGNVRDLEELANSEVCFVSVLKIGLDSPKLVGKSDLNRNFQIVFFS